MEGKVGAAVEAADKTTSPSKPMLRSLIQAEWAEGLKLAGVLSPNNLIYIPSTKNVADGLIQFRAAIIDTGCSSYLIRVDSVTDFERILKRYQDTEKYIMQLGSSIGVSGVSETLIIRTVSQSGSFGLVLAEDLFGGDAVQVKKLRFQLCTEDARFATTFPGIERLLSPKQLASLESYCAKEIPRILVSLIGQSVLCHSSNVLHEQVFYCLDAAQCSSVSFPALSKVSQRILEELDPSVKEMMAALDFDITTADEFHFRDTEFDF
jgi:hypothetical protein